MERKIIYTDKAPEPIGNYSQAVLVGNTLYVSGQIALDASTGKVIREDVMAETEQVIQNINFILHACNMNLENVVKCSIFITNMEDFGLVNATYGKYFSENPPARETVEVSALPKEVSVEISCIAIAD